MLNKDVIRNIIILTITFICLILVITISSFIASAFKYKKENYYIIGNDKIPSVYEVIQNKKLYSYKDLEDSNSNVHIYKYKDIDNPKSDIYRYINELQTNYDFFYASDNDLSKNKGTIRLTSNSKDKGMIIIMDISYTKNNYEIKITKEKGNVN